MTTQSTILEPCLSSITCDWTYDVFLSFRGIDTRNSFTGNLYNSLDQKGIHTFIDDQELSKGDEITPALHQAIKESRIFIAVFSTNYASSTHCLNELVTILQCLKTPGRLFLPVFYDVDPSQVRHQSGTYAEALAKLEDRFREDKEKVQKWKDALREAANVSGWHFQPGSELEYKFISKIVEVVSTKINRIALHVADKPVGLGTQVLKVASLLGLESESEPDKGVNMLGIYGIGGIGKSTIARAVYNLIADQFEGACFLADIRKKVTNHGLEQLQEAMLSEILDEKDIKVRDVYRGISIIKRRLHRKKVLLIIDNVDKEKQLQALAGGCEWFGAGSKIIITTRNKHLLATCGIVKLHEVQQLKKNKALELFSWHAFKNNDIDPCYKEIASRAVSYAQGLPLALEVIGSHLFGKSLGVWKSALDKYERILHTDIHEILKVSYDDLGEDEKGIFLDIACFFNSYEMSYVKEILYLHGFHAEDGIQVLTDKSLIKIDRKGCVRMHDLIQDMGREIVRQESTLEPGRCSRLWSHEDIIHVLEENTLESLTFLDFEGCKLLTELPNVSGLPNLGALCLDDCTNLIRIHKSVGFLDRLVLLSTQGCTKLDFLVPAINLPSLETLDLRGCFYLNSFPEVLGVMENIRDVYLDQTAIEILPFSIGNLVGIQRLFLRECQRLLQLPNSIRSLPKLEIIMNHGFRGFQWFECKENAGSEVFPRALLVHHQDCATLVHVYSLNTSPSSVIQVCSFSHDFVSAFGDCLRYSLPQGIIKNSPICFWFRNKFPRISLCGIGEPPTFEGNTMLDFKLSVIINGTEEFSFSSNYIRYAPEKWKTDLLLLFYLECKAERSFIEHEWNHVEILYEWKYPMQFGSKRVMRNPTSFFIHSFKGNREDLKSDVKSAEMDVKELQRLLHRATYLLRRLSLIIN